VLKFSNQGVQTQLLNIEALGFSIVRKELCKDVEVRIRTPRDLEHCVCHMERGVVSVVNSDPIKNIGNVSYILCHSRPKSRAILGLLAVLELH